MQKIWRKAFFSICLTLIFGAATPTHCTAGANGNKILERKFSPPGIFYRNTADSSDAGASKSPRGAMLRSLAVPGWGQWYNEKKLKAAVVFAAELGITINSVVQNQWLKQSETDLEKEYYLNNRNLSNWALAAVILVSMLDAYVDAHLYHFDESPDLAIQSARARSATYWLATVNVSF